MFVESEFSIGVEGQVDRKADEDVHGGMQGGKKEGVSIHDEKRSQWGLTPGGTTLLSAQNKDRAKSSLEPGTHTLEFIFAPTILYRIIVPRSFVAAEYFLDKP